MSDREPGPSPTSAPDLVAAVADLLEGALVPALSGPESFQARVAVRALRIVERELEHSPPAADRLTGPDGAEVTRAALATSIKQGYLDAADPAVRELLARDVLDRIGVDSPDYPTVREARLTWPGLR